MHFLVMLAFAIFVAIIFAGVNPDATSLNKQVMYGLKVFGSFVGIGLAIAWLFYFFPR